VVRLDKISKQHGPQILFIDASAAILGGGKMRVALSRILLMRPNVLLLDEPSNHLDIKSIIWLEGFLRNPGTRGSVELVDVRSIIGHSKS
jgi:ATPase subunit of ABC transporter with duplicated ATPase domains